MGVCDGPKPVHTVKQLRKVFFKKTKDRESYFRNLAMNEYWIEQSAKNLFSVLDKDNKGFLRQDEMKPVFDVLIRRGAPLVSNMIGPFHGFLVGSSWGLTMLVDHQTESIFRDKILPFSSSKRGADMFNFKVTIRNSLLFSSAANESQIDTISQHFYRIGRIDYNICHPSDIPRHTG